MLPDIPFQKVTYQSAMEHQQKLVKQRPTLEITPTYRELLSHGKSFQRGHQKVPTPLRFYQTWFLNRLQSPLNPVTLLINKIKDEHKDGGVASKVR